MNEGSFDNESGGEITGDGTGTALPPAETTSETIAPIWAPVTTQQDPTPADVTAAATPEATAPEAAPAESTVLESAPSAQTLAQMAVAAYLATVTPERQAAHDAAQAEKDAQDAALRTTLQGTLGIETTAPSKDGAIEVDGLTFCLLPGDERLYLRQTNGRTVVTREVRDMVHLGELLAS